VSCDFTRTVLHGYLDGELDAARAAEFERHLENCRDCANALGAEESLRASLRRVSLYEQAPVALQPLPLPFGFPLGVGLPLPPRF